MRLEELEKEQGDLIVIEWKSFLLRPQPESRTRQEFTEYTKSWERPAGLEPRAEFTTPWSGESAPPSHSLPAAIASKTAATFGQETWQRYHRNLLKAYFIENRDISSSDELLKIADESEIDKAAFEGVQTTNGETFKKQVFDEYNEALHNGVNGVPAVVIDNRFLISGAVEVEQYQKALDHYREIREKEGKK